MSQSNAGDFPIDPQVTSGTALAEILNRFYNATNTQNSGATEPPVTYPGMFWYDTSVNPPVLKIRNAGNSGWVDFADSIALTPADITGLGTMATVNSPAPIANGGTSATTAAQALINLGADSRYVYKTGDTMTGELRLPRVTLSNRTEVTKYYDGARYAIDQLQANWYWAFDTTTGNLQWSRAGGRNAFFIADGRTQDGAFVSNVAGFTALDAQNAQDRGGGVWGRTVLNANPNWNGMTMEAIHVQGQWAGWRFWSSTGYADLYLSQNPSRWTNCSIAQADNANTLAGYQHYQFIKGDNCEIMGFMNGDSTRPYMRYQNGAIIRQIILNEVVDTDTKYFRLNGINQGVNCQMFGIGDRGYYGVTANYSDERVKDNIAPSKVNGVESVKKIKLIEFTGREDPTLKYLCGFSAQNLKTVDNNLSTDYVPAEDTPQGMHIPMIPNDLYILAYVTKALQEVISRVEALEAV